MHFGLTYDWWTQRKQSQVPTIMTANMYMTSS